MANKASAVSRVVINITSSTPTVTWPNYGSVMHEAYTTRQTGYGNELGQSAGAGWVHYGSDIKPGGGVKQNMASFLHGRYCTAYYESRYVVSIQYPSGGSGQGAGWGGPKDPIINYGYYYSGEKKLYSVEHYPDVPTTIIGFCVNVYGLCRLSHWHEPFGAGYVHVKVFYRLASNPSYTHVVNYGHVSTIAIPWDAYYAFAFDKSMGSGDPFVYFKVEVLVGHGLGMWHDAGHGVPGYWSPNDPICTGAHPVGIGANNWRSIDNGNYERPVVDAYTLWYKPNTDQARLPKKHFSPSRVEGGNYGFSLAGLYSMPMWNHTPPYGN